MVALYSSKRPVRPTTSQNRRRRWIISVRLRYVDTCETLTIPCAAFASSQGSSSTATTVSYTSSLEIDEYLRSSSPPTSNFSFSQPNTVIAPSASNAVEVGLYLQALLSHNPSDGQNLHWPPCALAHTLRSDLGTCPNPTQRTSSSVVRSFFSAENARKRASPGM